MRSWRLVWAVGVAVVAGAAFAGEADVDALAKEFLGQSPAVKRTPAELEAAYGAIIDAWLPKMSSDNMPDRKDPEQKFQDMCFRAGTPGAEANRLAVCKAMVARLAKPELGRWPRVWFLKQLQLIGRAESVDAIAAQFDSKDQLVRERARTALQHNPAPEATAKLVAALQTAKTPKWQVALANALAVRGDAAAVPALLKLATAANDDVRSAVLEALARCGDKAVAATIEAGMTRGSQRAKRRATDAYLHLADRLAAAGDKAPALDIYRKFLGSSSIRLRCAAIVGIGRAGGVKELDTIFNALADKNIQVRGAAIEALGLLPGREVADAITARMKTATPELKVVLLGALARGRDKGTLPTFAAAAADPDEAVRIAAFEGMSALRTDAAAPTLIAALAKARDKELQAVKNAINAIAGEAMTAALVKAMDGAAPATKVQLIECLAARRDASVAPTLLKAAADPDAAVRTAALKALASVGDAKALPELAKLLVAAKDNAERAAAERTYITIARRVDDEDARTAPVLALFAKAQAPARVAIIRIAAALGGAKALECVRAAMKDKAPEVQEAAFRALPNWADPSVARDLLAIARSDASLTRRVLAIRGAVGVASKIGGLPDAELRKLFESALAVAPRPEDKKMVLGAMGSVASLGVLDLALKCLDDPTLRAEAEIAAVRIARQVSASYKERAKQVLKSLNEKSKNPQVKREATEAIAMLERFEDYITAWQVSGPYRKAGKDGPGLFDVAFPPEKPGDKSARWRPMPVGTDKGRPWLIEFDKTRGIAGSNAVVYLRTRVFSPKKQKARIEAGSDDGIKVWLNGKVVHANNATRPISPGSDKANVTLEKGWNDLLVKVTQGGGQWCVCLRFRGPNGERLEGLVADPTGE